MITAQDIREKTFEKAVFGGYDMATVDAFLEEVANDLLLLQKENTTLKGKMKVLVDKVEEYRRNEDALQMAVVSAQKMGSMIEKDATRKRKPSASPRRPPMSPGRKKRAWRRPRASARNSSTAWICSVTASWSSCKR